MTAVHVTWSFTTSCQLVTPTMCGQLSCCTSGRSIAPGVRWRDSHTNQLNHSSWDAAATKQAYPATVEQHTTHERGRAGGTHWTHSGSTPYSCPQRQLNTVHALSLRVVLKECMGIRAGDETTNSETAILSLTEEEEGRLQ